MECCCGTLEEHKIVKKASVGISVLIFLVLVAGSLGAASAGGPPQLITKYPLSGSPYRVAVEAAERVWVTLPARNAIGRLVVVAGTAPVFEEFHLPTAGSQPYDIVYAADSVWVSDYLGNKIARFVPLTGVWTEYPIPTPASKPTGLTVLPGEPIQVWFCEQASSKLGLLTITSTGASQFAEFPLPWTGAELANVAATSSENVWFTAPGKSLLGQFALSAWLPPQPGDPDPGRAFGFAPLDPGARPQDIKVDAEQRPWFTEPTSNRIGRFNPATTTSFEWYPVRTPSSGLAGLDLALGYVWFTERNAERMGRLQKTGYRGDILEQRVPGIDPAPTDIAMGPDGCAWVSASGTDALVSWCAPYFRQLYLPLIQRNK
jgi:virginiamycin B lyase